MYHLTLIIIMALTSLNSASSSQKTSPSPVKNLDIESYLGEWNQLAAIPASFQKNCVANTTAEYSLLNNGLIKVVNSCDQKDGKRKESEARARVNENIGLDSTLEVTFVKIFKWIWSFGGDYWVIYISDNYDIAIVGHPEYKFGWILSKKAALSKDQYLNLRNELSKQGYNPCEFIMSETTGQEFANTVSLCDHTADTN